MSDTWQRWYRSLTWRQRIRWRIDNKLAAWENWLATRNTKLVRHDWLYVGPPDGWLVKPFCLIFSHEVEGARADRRCRPCGKAMP